ncbi:MAG TPA: erythromycin esterase family protein [Chitinophagaceae bacterium]|nr:erythromycin esterase family protein [Chitinophagaceae bacterium]
MRWSTALFLAVVFVCCHTIHNSNTRNFTSESKTGAATIPFHPLEKDADLEILIREVGNANIVLLGESTHGTHEYYTWRTAITKKLIEEKGFDFIAVEGDWDDSYKINQLIHGPLHSNDEIVDVLKQYDRWPSSMWGNYEMVSLVNWLNQSNQGRARKVGFYGLDLYSFWEWTEKGTDVEDTAVRSAVKKVKDYFAGYNNDAMIYADSVRHLKMDGSGVAQHLWYEVQRFTGKKQPKDESGFLLYQHAKLTLEGELYFRTMTKDRVKAINRRDAYMAETIRSLVNFYGPNSKAVVWVHNGHAGDARYSSMSSSGYASVAEILKEQSGRGKIFSVGFGTYKGSVMAGYSWNTKIQLQSVLPAKGGSWEYLLHRLSPENKIIFSKELAKNPELNKWIEFRSIGAAYEGAAIYSRSIIPKRFDAFVFIDSTNALHPIENSR